MVKVKFCGITSYDDAKAALDLGVDALGFNFFHDSPRHISIDQAREIVRKLPASGWFVGVFVNQQPDVVREIAKTVGLDTLQFHGDESPEYCSKWENWRTIKALRLRPDSEYAEVAHFMEVCDHLLFDAYDPEHFGGTGREVAWDLLENSAVRQFMSQSFLAGGLNPQNVAERVEEFRPFGVDVASGIEIAPGKKSFQQMKAFLKAIEPVSG